MEELRISLPPLPPWPERAGPELAALLAERREALNARFFLARSSWPSIDEKAFGGVFLWLAGHCPRPAERLEELFDLALELVGRDLLSPAGLVRYPGLDRLVAGLVQSFSAVFAEQPRGLVFSFLNLFESFYRMRPLKMDLLWHRLSGLAPFGLGLADLKKAGAVVAWQACFAHYRDSALQAAAELPEAVVRYLFDPAGRSGLTAAQLVETAAREPWTCWLTKAEGPLSTLPAPEELRWIGRFRGFGGRFLQPPLAGYYYDRPVILADGQVHEISIDYYGTVLLPRPEMDPKKFTIGENFLKQPAFQPVVHYLTQQGLTAEGLSSGLWINGAVVVTSKHFLKVFIVPPPVVGGARVADGR